MNATAPRPAAVSHHLFVTQLRDVVGLWLLFVAGVALLTAVVAIFTDVTLSAWGIASTVPRWFALGWGAYLTAVYLPLYIAHGYTRREFARRALPFIAAFAVVLAVLVTLGFAIEWAAYSLLDWPQRLSDPSRLYDSATQYHLIAVEQFLAFVVWILVGAMAGAGCYRGVRWGTVTVVMGLAALAATSLVLGTEWPFERLTLGPIALGGDGPDLTEGVLAGLVYVTVVAVAAALTWLAVRDLPMRTRNT